jgi:CheY-like chemotaxis protein
MHGGTIAASSAGPGHGSTFTVTLPVSTETPAEAPIVVSGKVVRARRVMIVDDNVDAAFTLSLLLKHKGHDVHATNGAKEALDLARTFRPEVIFLDIGMPELDGYEACRRIRQMDAVKHAYVVALTGWGQDRDRRRAIEAGFDAHLVKPVDPDRIDTLLADMPERIGMHLA